MCCKECLFVLKIDESFQITTENFFRQKGKHYIKTDDQEKHEWVVWGGGGIHGWQALEEPNKFQEESSILTAAITIIKDWLFSDYLFDLESK